MVSESKGAYKRLLEERAEENAFLLQLQLAAEGDKQAKLMWFPRKGPSWLDAAEDQKAKIRNARREGGTIPSCGERCFGGRGVIGAGNSRELLIKVPTCCQRFRPLDASLRTRGMDYIINTDHMEEDLQGLEYCDQSIVHTMQAGARLYYTGDKRDKRQEFKN